jgi:hypothetical protein
VIGECNTSFEFANAHPQLMDDNKKQVSSFLVHLKKIKYGKY